MVATPTSASTEYKVTGTATSGPACTKIATVIVTANPLATLSSVNTSAVCSGTNTTVTLNGLLNNSTSTVNYTIGTGSVQTISGVAGSASGIGTFQIPVTTADNGKTLTITSIGSSINAGPSCSKTFTSNNTTTLTVKPIPDAIATPATQTICSGSPFNIALSSGVSGTTFNWTSNVTSSITGIGTSGSESNISGTPTNTTSNPVSVTFNITPTANGCVGPQINSSMVVNPTVKASISGSPSVCAGSSASLSIVLSGAGNISGTLSDGTPFSGTSGTITVSVSPSETAIYRISTLTNGTCPSLPADKTGSATVTVTPRPTAVLSGTQEICSGSSATLSLAVTGPGTISGTLSDGTTFSGTAPTITVNVSPTANTTYTISTLSNGNCVSIASDRTGSATVTVNPLPEPTITAQGPTASCTGAVQLTSSAASTYQWYKDSVAIQLATQETYPATLPGTYYVAVTNSSLCPGTSNSIAVSFITNSWTAAVDNDWNKGGNWCSGQVPTASTDAMIPSGLPLANYPELFANAQVKSLTIQSGATVDLKGKTLTINGTLTGTGKFVGSNASSLTLNGTSPVTLNFDETTDGSTNALKDLTIETPGTVNLNNKLYLSGTLSPNSSTLNINDTLTLRSTSIANTARIAAVSGSINGVVTVERFIPAKRSFRFLSPSVTTPSGSSIRDNWMEGALNPNRNTRRDPKPGYGTNITGQDSTLNGFDPTISNNPSLFTFNTGSQSWVPASNTNSNLVAGNAYRLMVRGSRNTDMTQADNNPTATNTILRATGTLITGDHPTTISGTAGNYTFIGNPYASPVDFGKIFDDNSDKISSTYYTWDPMINVRGAYVVYNVTQNTSSNSSSQVGQNIQSGQAFFVRTTGSSTSLTFKESYKNLTIDTGNTYVFRNPVRRTKLSVQLLLNINAGMENNADGVVTFFDDKFTPGISNEDSYKFTNLDENLAIDRNGTALSMEGRPTVTADDTIPLKMWQFRQNNYYLRLTGSNFAPDETAFVKDRYLQKETPVDLASVTLHPCSITTDSASFAKDRFSIVFKPGKALPVTLTNVKAYQKDNGIQVDWTAEAETNIESYEVEKSVDGQKFEKTTAVTAKGNNPVIQTYGWLDENANTGSNFYRIKVIEKSGAVKYSNVVKVNIAAVNSSLTVFPNPIKDNLIKVQFNNMEKGRYSTVLYNTLGQKLYSNIIEHTARSATYTISLGRLISKGIYTLHISKGDIKINERVVVE